MADDGLTVQEACNFATMGLTYPDSKVHGAKMGTTCGRQDPGGLHIGPMDLAIWIVLP